MHGSATQLTSSPLKAGNQLLRSGLPAEAVALYAQGMLGKGRPFGVYELLATNLLKARQQWLRNQQAKRPMLGMLGNTVTERTKQLQVGHSTWAKVITLSRPDTSGPWFDQLASQVLQNPLHVLQLMDPDAPAIAAALLYQAIWGTRVFVDLCCTHANPPATDLLTHQLTDDCTPSLLEAAHQTWPSLALSLAPAFDALTVSTPALQQRHGGVYLPTSQAAADTMLQLWKQATGPALPLEVQRLTNALWRQAAHGLLALPTRANTAQPSPPPNQAPHRVVVLVHAHYPHIWPEIANLLAKVRYPFDLLVTAPEAVCQQLEPSIRQRFASAQLQPMKADSDMAALVAALPALLAQPYLAICKLHTKQGQGEHGTLWRQAMLEALIGHPDTFTQVVQAFANEPRLTIVGPAELYFSAQRLMFKNRSELEGIFHHHHNHGVPSHDWGFFAGSCLWIRPQALTHLAAELPKHEAGKKDGTWAHAMERYLGYLPYHPCQLIEKQQTGLVGLLHRPATPGAYAIQITIPGDYISQCNGSKKWAKTARKVKEIKHHPEQALVLNRYYERQDPALLKKNICMISHYLLIGQYQIQNINPNP